jgi:hypothetical protein
MIRTAIKTLLIIGAFLSAFVLAFSSIAEAMGAPSYPVPFSFAADKIVAIMCFVLCCLAPFRARVAGILIWLIFVPYATWFFIGNKPSEFFGGVPLYLTIVAFCLTLAAFAENKASAPIS